MKKHALSLQHLRTILLTSILLMIISQIRKSYKPDFRAWISHYQINIKMYDLLKETYKDIQESHTEQVDLVVFNEKKQHFLVVLHCSFLFWPNPLLIFALITCCQATSEGLQTQMRFPWFIGYFSHLLEMLIMKGAYQLLDLKGPFPSVFNYCEAASLIFLNAATLGGTLKSFIDSKLVFYCHLLVNGIYHLKTKSLVSCFHIKTN